MSTGTDDAGRPGEVDEASRPQIDFLPWHAQARDRVGSALAAARLPHGLLVQGAAGIGKEQFAATFAAALLCSRRASQFEACRQCDECRLTLAGNHPDLHWLRPTEDRKSIGVDQVRETCADLSMTSMRRGYRIAIVVPADAMTVSAQNSLLKTLEEPPPRTVLVLVTARPSRLLPTLRSRCQRIEIARPPRDVALAWLGHSLGRPAPASLLALAGGAPRKALGLAPHFDDLERQMQALLEAFLGGRIEVTRAAADMQGEGLSTRLDWLEAWLGDALRTGAGVGNETGLTVPRGSPLQRLASELNITAAFQVLDRLREARRLLDGSASPPLVVESLLLALRSARRPGR